MWTENVKLGILLALGSAVCFALSNTLAGLAYAGGSTPLSLATVRFILPATILLIILKFRDQPILLPKGQGIAAAILGLITVAYTIALLSAIKLLPAAIAVLIFYLFPILTAFILAALGWIKLSLGIVAGALVAFAGLTLTLGVKFDELDIAGMALAAAAALGLAIVSVVSNRLMRGQDPRQATLYMSTAAMVTMFFITAVVGDFELPQGTRGWVGFSLSTLLYALAMIGYYAAISMIGAAKAALLSNLEPLIVVGAAFLLLNQSLVSTQLLGIAIVVSALYIIGMSKEG